MNQTVDRCPVCRSRNLIDYRDPATGDGWVACLDCGTEQAVDE